MMRNYLFMLAILGCPFTGYTQNNIKSIEIELSKKENPAEWILVYAPDGLMGYINREGKEIVPPVFKMIYPFGEYKQNWARVEILGDLTGFIDTTGKFVVEPKYEYIEKFGKYREDWALVCIDDQFGFINSQGKEIVPPIYSEIPFINKKE